MASRLNLTRRRLLQGATAFGAATAAGLGYNRPAGAAAPERKFIFFFASGGWDTTTVFDPHFDSDGVDMDPMTELGEAGNLMFTAGDDRPNVKRFFQRWGRRAAICKPLKPPQLIPIIATCPSHQSCAAIQAIASQPSRCSCTVYSSSINPSLSPVPRMSSRIEA